MLVKLLRIRVVVPAFTAVCVFLVLAQASTPEAAVSNKTIAEVAPPLGGISEILTQRAYPVGASDFHVKAANAAVESPNEPNLPIVLPEIPLQGDPNDPPVGASDFHVKAANAAGPLPEKQFEYWRRCYHPQVTSRIFRILSYPYYPGGAEYAGMDTTVEITPAGESAEAASSEAAPVESGEEVQTKESAEATEDAVAETVETPAEPDWSKIAYAIQTCCDQVHQWRDLNESPGTALEIVRSVELTKTSTNIYQIDPNLAVHVKRTIGQIGLLNRRFDRTSRLVLNELLAGRYDEMLLMKPQKQLSDLKLLLERLAQRNDLISVALGVGKIDRRQGCGDADKINYSELVLPVTTE